MMPTSYLRAGLLRGLEQEQKLGVNPFKFGFIGGTDVHNSLTAIEEDNFFGKHVNQEPSPVRWEPVSKQGFGKTRYTWHYTAAGYAAVWATENTREALWDAMKRKEVYATSGTRMTVRLFAGWDFTAEDARSRYLAETGYAKGVPMGADLPRMPAPGKAPTFLVAAMKDAQGGNLDRIQIVKGWIDKAGQSQEQIYNVAWSDEQRRKPGKDGKLPAVGDTVDVARATWTNTIGDPELVGVWKDPSFDPSQRAYYYARVIEIPTPRWTAYDAVRFNIKMPPEVPMKHQERAWTSPVWYTPDPAQTPQPSQSMVFACDEREFLVRVSTGQVELVLPDRTLVLPQVPAASGARYQEGANLFWSQGSEARFEIDGKVYSGCLRRSGD